MLRTKKKNPLFNLIPRQNIETFFPLHPKEIEIKIITTTMKVQSLAPSKFPALTGLTKASPVSRRGLNPNFIQCLDTIVFLDVQTLPYF